MTPTLHIDPSGLGGQCGGRTCFTSRPGEIGSGSRALLNPIGAAGDPMAGSRFAKGLLHSRESNIHGSPGVALGQAYTVRPLNVPWLSCVSPQNGQSKLLIAPGRPVPLHEDEERPEREEHQDQHQG